MGARQMDGWTALTLGAMAGGCTEARVTPAALTGRLAGALAGLLPGIGGRVRTLGREPAGPAEGPVLWVCTGEEAPAMLVRLAQAGEVEEAYGDRSMAAAAAAGVRATRSSRVVLISLPPAPGLTGVLAAAAPRYIWAPGSSRMAYRLAAAACREAGRGGGPCYLLLDGELPPETVAVPEDQVPGQEAPMVRTGPRDVESPAPPLLGADGAGELPDQERGRTPAVTRADLLTAVARAPGPEDLLPFHHAGPDDPDILLVGTGTTFGELARARTELLALGRQIAHVHVRQLRPLPVDLLHPIWTSARAILIQEAPGGGLAPYLRGLLPGGPEPVVVGNLDHLAATLQRLHEALPPPASRAEPGHWPRVPEHLRPPLPPPPEHHGRMAASGPAGVGGPPAPGAAAEGDLGHVYGPGGA